MKRVVVVVVTWEFAVGPSTIQFVPHTVDVDNEDVDERGDSSLSLSLSL